MRNKTEMDVTILNTSVERKRKGTDIKQEKGDKLGKKKRDRLWEMRFLFWRDGTNSKWQRLCVAHNLICCFPALFVMKCTYMLHIKLWLILSETAAVDSILADFFCCVCVSESIITRASCACGFMVWIVGPTTERMACGTINGAAYQMWRLRYSLMMHSFSLGHSQTFINLVPYGLYISRIVEKYYNY